MPPQQHDRLLDLIDDILDFRAHEVFQWWPQGLEHFQEKWAPVFRPKMR
jgi:hypothetical protein